jgi:hypothetical protein
MNETEQQLQRHLTAKATTATPIFDIERVRLGEPLHLSQPEGAARRPWLAPVAAALLVAAAAGLVLTVRAHDHQMPSTADDQHPAVGDHEHMAYGLYLCGQWVQLTGNKEETEGDHYVNELFGQTGIHSHDDGVIHAHPYGPAGIGAHATVGLFLNVYGVTLTDEGLVFPADQDDGAVYDETTTLCNGQPAQLSATVWPDANDPTASTTITDDLNSIHITDHAALTIAFMPPGSPALEPPSVPMLDELGLADATLMPADSSIPAFSDVPADTLP